MKVQNRLTLFTSVVFGLTFAVISALIYMFYYQNAKKSIYTNLEKSTNITALFYLEEDELNSEEFAKVREQFLKFVTNPYYQIYNENNEVSYGMQDGLVAIDILNRVREKRRLVFSDEYFFCYAIFYEDNQGDFVVVGKERKEELTDQLSSLLWILILAFVASTLAVIILSRWTALVAYRPFSKVINQVKHISIYTPKTKIVSPETKDELQDLIETFNHMLSKISETFVIQRNFVNYVSHEFKTPLAAILGNLEVFSLKDRTANEYKQLSEMLIHQIHQLQDILDTLIVVSDLRENVEPSSSIRVDELLWQIIDRLSLAYPSSKILIDTEIEATEEELLSINHNSTQLLIALYNLIENAVKYSKGSTVEIKLYKENLSLVVSIIDKGIGIPSEQLHNISKPFYRADNANQIQGSGIGLSIALRILEKNSIRYKISSEVGKGTQVLIFFDC